MAWPLVEDFFCGFPNLVIPISTSSNQKICSCRWSLSLWFYKFEPTILHFGTLQKIETHIINSSYRVNFCYRKVNPRKSSFYHQLSVRLQSRSRESRCLHFFSDNSRLSIKIIAYELYIQIDYLQKLLREAANKKVLVIMAGPLMTNPPPPRA